MPVKERDWAMRKLAACGGVSGMANPCLLWCWLGGMPKLWKHVSCGRSYSLKKKI